MVSTASTPSIVFVTQLVYMPGSCSVLGLCSEHAWLSDLRLAVVISKICYVYLHVASMYILSLVLICVHDHSRTLGRFC